ncbi:DUF1698 domain-containing protein [Limibaculum sp. FT325]|uniref:DUF1698 domain-containing protein n=1 Tax=Thermohalobaculum sediminis TaxID=2939436 RepID=UPI0020C04C9F|nr:DUF1698 domain-containing protein [Limibaculum sediminis]MCL5779286.1 DUF1698 domain-containing protein [Limibaculum sediminis]
MKDDILSYDFHQKIILPDGRITPGPTDHTRDPNLFRIGPKTIAGKRVLDIAANDGFWSFWSETQGASDVLAIDVNEYKNYDWGYNIPTEITSRKSSTDKSSNFARIKEEFSFKARRELRSVYQLNPARDGVFDVVFFYGLLYHLRHPLLAFDRIRPVCGGVLLLETHVAGADHLLPALMFYPSEFFGVTNWSGPTIGCCAAWMRDAGFTRVFREKRRKGQLRARMVGCVSEDWANHFAGNPNFLECDEEYFADQVARLQEFHQQARTSPL